MAKWVADNEAGETLGEYVSKSAMFDDLHERLGLGAEFFAVSQGASEDGFRTCLWRCAAEAARGNKVMTDRDDVATIGADANTHLMRADP